MFLTLIVVVAVLVFAALVFKAMWRVAEPNEALILSGLREHTPSDAVSESLGFRSSPARGRW